MAHEEKMFKLLQTLEFNWIVLAKYMRILTPFFVKIFDQKIINIHHSFLPFRWYEPLQTSV